MESGKASPRSQKGYTEVAGFIDNSFPILNGMKYTFEMSCHTCNAYISNMSPSKLRVVRWQGETKYVLEYDF